MKHGPGGGGTSVRQLRTRTEALTSRPKVESEDGAKKEIRRQATPPFRIPQLAARLSLKSMRPKKIDRALFLTVATAAGPVALAK